MALGKTIYFKKLVDSSVSLYMQDAEGQLQARWFVMEPKMPRIGVPANYALSIFTDDSLMAMYRANYFEIEKIEELEKMAVDAGYIAPTPEESKVLTAPKRTKETLLAIIKGGNQAKLEELFKSTDKDRALEIVQEKKNELSLDVLKKVETIIGVAILEE